MSFSDKIYRGAGRDFYFYMIGQSRARQKQWMETARAAKNVQLSSYAVNNARYYGHQIVAYLREIG